MPLLQAALFPRVLYYDIFTVVEDQAHLVLEHALRERFVAYYGGAVPTGLDVSAR